MGKTETRREIRLSGPFYLEAPGTRELAAPRPPLDFAAVFGRAAPVVLDLGAARARYFLNVAPHLREVDFIGVEIAKKRVEAALAKLAAARLANCRMIWGHALHVLEDGVAPGALAAVTVLFPDPWPKKRHAKRRIFAAPATAALVARALAPGGLALVKTDSASYAEAIAAAFGADPRLAPAADLAVALPGLAPFSLDRPEETQYEAAFKDEGRATYRMAFRRT
jgi:tRNA (guanine-N7-)-methyltransferase